MKIKDLDVLRLKDGRTATVLDVFESGTAYLVEIADENGKTLGVLTVSREDIECVTYTA